MLRPEKKYDFKKELLEVHKKDRRNFSLTPDADELALDKPVLILLKDNSEVIYTAARDFADYMLVSMNVPATVYESQIEGMVTIECSLSDDLGEYQAFMGYRLTVTEKGVKIEGADERGIAQALFYIEDLMNIRRAPFLKIGTTCKKSLYTQRNSQSPFGMNSYPDEAFAWMAHLGMSAHTLWLKDYQTTKGGEHIDIPVIVKRAARWGIDIYIDIYAFHSAHPDDEGAEEFYDNMYGPLLSYCPEIKGIGLVGEAQHFNSHDPRVGKTPLSANTVEGIPTGKLSPGWFPCNDYPQWIELIQKVARKYNPDIEVMFCTYNWGFVDKDLRVELIKNLPAGITVNATWDIFEHYNQGENTQRIADYTLSFVGPGKYFISEAEAVHARGDLKLMSTTNSSGKTWDFGVIPYEPMAQQWIRRFYKMIEANEKYGLTALCENIHYGFYPSIIAELEKAACFTLVKPLEETLKELLVRDFEENAEKAEKAMDLFSRGINYYTPTNEEQYCAFRIGPAYPIWSNDVVARKRPDKGNPMFGNGIYFATYYQDLEGRGPLPGVKIFEEIELLGKFYQYMADGIAILESCQNPNDKVLRLLNMAKFMLNCIKTGIHVKEHYIVKQKLTMAGSVEVAGKLLDEMQAILEAERENVLATIPLVRVDSILGWEPSMEYACDEEALEWKLRQLDYEINVAMNDYRKANSYTAEKKEFFDN